MPVSMRRDRMVQKGSIPVALLQVQKSVTFDTPMPGPYDLYFKDLGGVAITGVTQNGLTGFTVNISITLAGSFDWVAVERVS